MVVDTLPKYLRQNAVQYANQIALREKRFGIWQSITWAGYLLRVRHFAMGLRAMGFKAGDRVAIIGDNRPEWVISELASQALGGASIGIYQDSVVEEVTYIVKQCDARFIVVEDQEQVDKLLEIRDQLKTVQKLIYYDPRGLRHYNDDFLVPFPDVEELGATAHLQEPHIFDQSIDRGQGRDVAIISTTSGTTSRPKLAQITHDNLISMGRGLTQVDPFEQQHQFVSFLPLAWIGEQMISIACGMITGFAISFPEEPGTVQIDLREIGPHVMFAPPRIWENMLSTVQVKIEDADWLKRKIFHWAINIGQKAADLKFAKKSPGLLNQIQLKLAQWLVFTNLLDQLGLLHIRWAYTGGAALGPDVFRFYHAMGVNLKQGYGQTETTGICVIHRDDDIKFQTVGKPFIGVELMVDDSGEILARGPMCFAGYYNQPEATTATLTADGWVHTGDAGYFDEEGHLIVIDRAKDVMTLHDGTKFSPQFIENKLKFSPYIREAVVFGGEDYPFVTAMINIDFGTVGKWAENQKLSYTTYTDLAQKPEVYQLIFKDVVRTNDDLPAAAKIQRYLLLHKELDADDAELTRTRKVRRGFVSERYKELIDGLYSESDQVDIVSTITYQDGRTQTLELTLHIEAVNKPVGVR